MNAPRIAFVDNVHALDPVPPHTDVAPTSPYDRPFIPCIASTNDYGPYIACGRRAIPNRGFCERHA